MTSYGADNQGGDALQQIVSSFYQTKKNTGN